MLCLSTDARSSPLEPCLQGERKKGRKKNIGWVFKLQMMQHRGEESGETERGRERATMSIYILINVIINISAFHCTTKKDT